MSWKPIWVGIVISLIVKVFRAPHHKVPACIFTQPHNRILVLLNIILRELCRRHGLMHLHTCMCAFSLIVLL